MSRHAELMERGSITGEELQGMGEMGPCELIDGRIVPMTPAGGEHGRIELSLAMRLKEFVTARKLGWVMTGEVGIYTQRDPDRVRGADVAFVSRERMAGGAPKGFLEEAPDLVAEVMSPTDRWVEVQRKIAEYFATGVDRVWIVEPENRAVSVFVSATESHRLGEEDELVGEGALAGFSLRVARLFDE